MERSASGMPARLRSLDAAHFQRTVFHEAGGIKCPDMYRGPAMPYLKDSSMA